MPNAVEITISDMLMYQRCPKRFDYSSGVRQNLKIKGSGPDYFKIGTIWHDALEQFYLGHDDIQAYFKEQIQIEFAGYNELSEKLVSQLNAGVDLIRDYKTWAEQYATFDVVSTEERHTIRLNEVTPGLFFSFKYDLLVRIDGNLWLVDFKTSAGKLPHDPSTFEYSDQALAYQWALEKVLGERVLGAMFVYIHKNPPTRPKLNQNGSVKKRSNLRSTPNTYLDVIHEQGLDPDDYTEFLQMLNSNLNGKFFRRVDIISCKQRRETHKLKVTDFGNRILNDNLHIYTKQSTQECNACEFLEPCQLIQMGMSDKKLLSMKYEERKPRD